MYVALCARMERYGWQSHAQQRHVLHYQRVHSYAIEPVYEPLHCLKFVIVYYGVDGHVDSCSELVGIVHCAGYVLERIAGSSACAVACRAHIHGIGAVAYGFDGYVGIACRCQQFDGTR